MSKYRNKKSMREYEGVHYTFDSKAEASRFDELLVLLLAGEITNLRTQVKFELVPSVHITGQKRKKPALRYYADFVYIESSTGVQVIEDVKGMKTQTYTIKKHLLHWRYGEMFESGQWRFFENNYR